MRAINDIFFRHSEGNEESEKMSETYFFDTYAFVEIVKGTGKFEKYKDSKIVTSLLNLMELHYSCLKDLGKEKAQEIFSELTEFTIDIEEQDIINANYFKFNQNKKGKNISYVDSIGYILSLKNGIKFLTGDKAFRDIENVEFVE
jgi:uncharacterized protein